MFLRSELGCPKVDVQCSMFDVRQLLRFCVVWWLVFGAWWLVCHAVYGLMFDVLNVDVQRSMFSSWCFDVRCLTFYVWWLLLNVYCSLSEVLSEVLLMFNVRCSVLGEGRALFGIWCWSKILMFDVRCPTYGIWYNCLLFDSLIFDVQYLFPAVTLGIWCMVFAGFWCSLFDAPGGSNGRGSALGALLVGHRSTRSLGQHELPPRRRRLRLRGAQVLGASLQPRHRPGGSRLGGKGDDVVIIKSVPHHFDRG